MAEHHVLDVVKEPGTLNEMFAAAQIVPGEPGSLWVEQKPCPRCKQVIWWAKDGHDLKARQPQVHACKMGL